MLSVCLRCRCRAGGRIVVPVARDLEAMVQAIEKARPSVDVLVVSIHMHWGDNTFKEAFAEYHPLVAGTAIDAGADLFLIHGPHVLGGIEAYKHRFIAYSIGNLSWNTPWTDNQRPIFDLDETFDSIVVRAVVEDKRVRRLEVLPIVMYRSGGYKGIPKLPDAKKDQEILELVRKLSAHTRTNLEFENWCGPARRRTDRAGC